MQTPPVNFPVYFDVDKNPVNRPFTSPLVKDPSEIRWSREKQKWYQVTGMPHIYCDGGILLLDRSRVEVQMWLCDKKEIEELPAEAVQNVVKECPNDGLTLLQEPLAYRAVNGAAAWACFDIGLDEPLSLNAEAYTWLKHEGYTIYAQPDARTNRVILRRRSDVLAGVLMPGNGKITIRQIYKRALKPPYAIFDLMGERMVDKEAEAKTRLRDREKQAELDNKLLPPGFKTNKYAAGESLNVLEDLYEFVRHSKQSIYTGYYNIDSMLGGIFFGNLAVVAGDSVSSFLANIVRKNALRTKKPVSTAVICLQKAIPELGIQLICMEGRLMTREIRRGMIKESDWPKLARAEDGSRIIIPSIIVRKCLHRPMK